MGYVKWLNPLRKPPRGAIIDYSDPLVKKMTFYALLNEFDGDPFGYKINPSSTGTGDVIGYRVSGAHWFENGIATTQQYQKLIFNDDCFQVHGDMFSIVVRAKRYGPSGQDPNYIVANEDTDYYRMMVGDGDGRYRVSINTGSGEAQVWSSAYVTDTNLHSFGMVRIGANAVSAYFDGKFVGSASVSSSFSGIEGGTAFRLGNNQPSNGLFNGLIESVYFFRGVILTDDEILRLSNEPYSFFLVPVPKTYIVVPSTGQTVILKRRKWLDWQRKPPRGARIDYTNPITKGLVGCWLFNEYGGRNIKELSQDIRSYLKSGALWENGGINCYLNGAVTYLTIRDGNRTIEKEFTVISKIIPGASMDAYDRFISDHDGSDYGLIFSVDSSGNYARTLIKDYTGTSYFAVGNESLQAGKEYIVTGRYDGDFVELWQNGKKLASTSAGNELIHYTGNHIHIGENENGDNAFAGWIYFSYIYNRALTDEEIKFLSENPYSFFELPAQYIVQTSGTGSTATIESGSLTLTGYDVTVQVSATATIESGTLTLTGYDVVATGGGVAAIESGSLTLTGYDVTPQAQGIAIVESGSLVLTGYDVTVTAGGVVSIETGHLTITGYDVFATGGTTVDPIFYVYDKNGNGIENVYVALYQQPSDTLAASGYTDATGKVQFTGVASGNYRLLLKKAGYQKYEMKAYIEDGDDFKYRLYRQQQVVFGPCGPMVNLDPMNPENNMFS